MARSRKDPSRKSKLINYKSKNKKRVMSNRQNGLPEILQTPIWSGDDKIEINGMEWQAIADYISNSERAIGAFHAVMNKNVLNGTIKMKFQKLNQDGTEYVDVTPEEDAKHQQEFQDLLKRAKEMAAKAVAGARIEQENDQTGVPSIETVVNNTIVDANGTPLGDEPQEGEAKIITL